MHGSVELSFGARHTGTTSTSLVERESAKLKRYGPGREPRRHQGIVGCASLHQRGLFINASVQKLIAIARGPRDGDMHDDVRTISRGDISATEEKKVTGGPWVGRCALGLETEDDQIASALANELGRSRSIATRTRQAAGKRGKRVRLGSWAG
jgi:hypothetical protein